MNLNLTLATRIGMNICAFFGITVALYMGARIFIPVVFAVLLASVLFPFAKFFHERLMVPWFFSCLTALLGLLVLNLVVVGAFAWAIPQTIKWVPRSETE